MTDDPEDQEKDAELSRWLREGADPQPPLRLDARVAQSYRRTAAPSWAARAWRARLSLPAPVAALLLIVLVAAGAFARDVSRGRPHGAVRAGLARLKPLPEIQLHIAGGGR